MTRRPASDPDGAARGSSPLTERQYDVLVALADDLPRRAIAKKLGISVARLDEHMAALKRLAQAKTRVGVVLWALEQRLLEAGNED